MGGMFWSEVQVSSVLIWLSLSIVFRLSISYPIPSQTRNTGFFPSAFDSGLPLFIKLVFVPDAAMEMNEGTLLADCLSLRGVPKDGPDKNFLDRQFRIRGDYLRDGHRTPCALSWWFFGSVHEGPNAGTNYKSRGIPKEPNLTRHAADRRSK